MPRVRSLILLVLIAALGCRPQQQAPVVVPTLAQLPSQYQLEDAERVARDFLTNWHDGNLDAMYQDLSFSSQEANPLASFTQQYQSAEDTMTYQSLDIQANTIERERDSVADFNYDVTFHTRLIGDFTDSNRDLTLVVDDKAQAWRVAWTPDDIFNGMASGATLRLTSTIPNRANIYDSQGNVLADQNGKVVRLQVVPQQIPDMADCLNSLSGALGKSVSDVQTILQAHPNWVIDLGTVDPQVYQDTNQALTQYCGVTFKEQPTREYQTGAVAANLVGYVGYPDAEDVADVEAAGFNQDSILGRSGIELTWDKTLRGQPGETLTLVDSSGTPLNQLAQVTAKPGQSLWLTVDSAFQQKVEQIVASAYTQAKDSWGPTSAGASVVVMDPNTGQLYALVTYPSYDDNAYLPFPEMGKQQANQLIAQYTSDPRNPEVNRPTQGQYALGSTMKTVTAAAITDTGIYALNQSYVCTGVWTRDITRYDWLPGGHGRVTLASALTQSCDPYFYEAGYRLDQADPNTLPDYMKKAGFGGPTGLTDLAEDTGFIPTPNWKLTTTGVPWTFSDAVNIAVGQGEVQVTPLQVARWYSAIANGGSLPTPYLVASYGLTGDTLTPAHTPQMTPTNIKPEVLATIQGGLCAVTTSPVGTAEFVFRNSPLQALGVCGKTGTAQTGGADTPPQAWFASYAPRENPKVVVVVEVETAGEGSEVAAPIARQVLETYFGMNSSP